MIANAVADRLLCKSSLHAIQVELQHGYNLSPVEAQVLAQRLQLMIDERTGFDRSPGQVSYSALALDEPAGKPLASCRKVTVHLTVLDDSDSQVLALEGSEALRRLRVYRIVYEALAQDGVLTQEDIAAILAISIKSVKRIFAHFRQLGVRLPSRGEKQDIGPGVSHKIPIIRRYIRDLGFATISAQLGHHGFQSMARYLRHFALVMVLQDRGLSPTQMQSVIGISEGLIRQYQSLYAELDVPEFARSLQRLKGTAFCPTEPVSLDIVDPDPKKGASNETRQPSQDRLLPAS